MSLSPEAPEKLPECELISNQYAVEEDGLKLFRMEPFGSQGNTETNMPLRSSEFFSGGVLLAEIGLDSFSAAVSKELDHVDSQPSLPDIQIVDYRESGATAVGRYFAKGVLDEVVNHPGRIVASAAIGLGVGIGAAFVSPAAISVGVVLAGGYGLYTLANNIPMWIGSAKVVANPYDYSSEQVVMARTNIRDVGAGTVTIAASAIGALGAAPGVTALKSAFPAIARATGHSSGSTFGAAIFDDVVVPIMATGRQDGV